MAPLATSVGSISTPFPAAKFVRNAVGQLAAGGYVPCGVPYKMLGPFHASLKVVVICFPLLLSRVARSGRSGTPGSRLQTFVEISLFQNLEALSFGWTYHPLI